MKSYVREPRPLFVDSEIKATAKDCNHMEFGNPSSHAFGCSFCIPMMAFLLIRHHSIRFNLKSNWKLYLLASVFIPFLIALIGFSRVFKGLHTYN
jgi:membrane-associated phospholipid phosphatase